MKKTLFVSDLDGTLLLPEECLSPFTVETVRTLTEEGMLFSYATARSLSTAKKVTGELGKLHLPVIVYNGGTIADAADGNILEAVYFTAEEIEFVKAVLSDTGLRPLVYARTGETTDTERVAYVEQNISGGMQAYLDSRKGDPRFKTVSDEELYDHNVFYFTIIRDNKDELQDAVKKIREDERFQVYFDRDLYSGSWWLEVVPKRTTKANAVMRLAEILACEKIVCFGDGKNDLPMFSAADESYAVENADESLKAAATAVIGANTADGVAKKLLELWKNEKA